MRILRLPAAIILCLTTGTDALSRPLTNWKNDLRVGYEQRMAADPSFAKKSVMEVFLAASTQLSAEITQRGPQRMVPEIDFVVAGVLTAVIGKYYSMWKVAKTQQGDGSASLQEMSIFGLAVPTNAFQETMLDGSTKPTARQRLGSLIAPIPSLFRAGVMASILGYGLTAIAIQIRTCLLPSFVAATRQVNIAYAAIYTGAFMAVVSNLRYQLLQGLIEPFLDNILAERPSLLNSALFVTRVGNGWLGSILAIAGMKWLGLQKLK